MDSHPTFVFCRYETSADLSSGKADIVARKKPRKLPEFSDNCNIKCCGDLMVRNHFRRKLR